MKPFSLISTAEVVPKGSAPNAATAAPPIPPAAAASCRPGPASPRGARRPAGARGPASGCGAWWIQRHTALLIITATNSNKHHQLHTQKQSFDTDRWVFFAVWSHGTVPQIAAATPSTGFSVFMSSPPGQIFQKSIKRKRRYLPAWKPPALGSEAEATPSWHQIKGEVWCPWGEKLISKIFQNQKHSWSHSCYFPISCFPLGGCWNQKTVPWASGWHNLFSLLSMLSPVDIYLKENWVARTTNC